MNQLIKISNQSAKILGNYAKCWIHRFNSNKKLLHTRLVPAKNDLLGFLEFLKWIKVSEMKGSGWHNCFILVHSITELHPITRTTWAWFPLY